MVHRCILFCELMYGCSLTGSAGKDYEESHICHSNPARQCRRGGRKLSGSDHRISACKDSGISALDSGSNSARERNGMAGIPAQGLENLCEDDIDALF